MQISGNDTILPDHMLPDGWSVNIDFNRLQEAQAKEFSCVYQDEALRTLSAKDHSGCSNRYVIEIKGLISALVEPASRTISITADHGLSSGNTLRHLLLDAILPRALEASGQFVIHASAVRADGATFALIGESGLGKSTLSASFLADGHELLGDDAIVLKSDSSGTYGRAVYPSLRLFPDSLEAIFYARPPDVAVAHYTSKRALDFGGGTSGTHSSLPLTCFFILVRDGSESGVQIRPLAGAKLIITLISNSFALDPTDKGRGAKRLAEAGKIANHVPAFELSYPRDYSQLPEVREGILKTIVAIGGASADCR